MQISRMPGEIRRLKQSAETLGYQWLTTEANPRRAATGFDAGQTGYKLHAVEAKESEAFKDLRGRRALCGLRPRFGWGLDLYYDDPCDRCLRQVERRDQTSSKADTAPKDR